MSAERNKALVRRIVEGFLNPGDPGLAEELSLLRYVGHNPSNPGMGDLGNVKRSIADWRRGFPDTVTGSGTSCPRATSWRSAGPRAAPAGGNPWASPPQDGAA